MIENLLLSIEGCLALGFAFGFFIGILIGKPKLGCLILFAAPIAMIAYISWWQGQHPENLRSTSGLDFVFGSLWPSLGALCGYYLARGIRLRIGAPIE